MCGGVCGGGVGGGGGSRFSFSTCNHVRGATRRLLLDRKDILSLGVHFTADKNRRPPAHSCKWACNAGSIHFSFLIHPVFVKGKTLLLVVFETFCSPATQPGSDAVGRHSSFNMRDMFWATTTRREEEEGSSSGLVLSGGDHYTYQAASNEA